MSAAVRADLLDLQSSSSSSGHMDLQNEAVAGSGGHHSKPIQFCQDGLTPKTVSVILGCSSHSDLELRSSCYGDVDFPKGNPEVVGSNLWGALTNIFPFKSARRAMRFKKRLLFMLMLVIFSVNPLRANLSPVEPS